MRVGGAAWELPEPRADGKPGPARTACTGMGVGFTSVSTKQNTGNELQTQFGKLRTGDDPTSFGSAGRTMSDRISKPRQDSWCQPGLYGATKMGAD